MKPAVEQQLGSVRFVLKWAKRHPEFNPSFVLSLGRHLLRDQVLTTKQAIGLANIITQWRVGLDEDEGARLEQDDESFGAVWRWGDSEHDLALQTLHDESRYRARISGRKRRNSPASHRT